MWRHSENLVHRLFARQITRAPPNAHVQRARRMYENIVPSHTVYDVDCPDHAFRKFTNDGQYLICYSRNLVDLVVYRLNWLTYCCKGEGCGVVEKLPAKATKFDTYFMQLYAVSLATGNEVICKEFFLTTHNNLFGIFATSTTPDYSPPASAGAVPGVPSIEKITIFLVRLADGVVVDERSFHDDFILLPYNMGVFLYDDLLVVLSVRYQCIYILQVREAGLFVDVRSIGAHCREDDELKLNMQAQGEALFREEQAAIRKAKGVSTEPEALPNCSDLQKKTQPFCWSGGGFGKPESRQSGWLQSKAARQGSPANVSSQEATASTCVISTGLCGGEHGLDHDLHDDNVGRRVFLASDSSGLQQTRNQGAENHAGDPSPSLGSNVKQRRSEINGLQVASVNNSHALRGCSVHESGQQNGLAAASAGGKSLQPGPAPHSWRNRPLSSASGESGDMRSERTSHSYRASSTTITTTTCSGSGSGSGCSRRDRSVTGGSVCQEASVSVHSVEASRVEYAVSSRGCTGSRPTEMEVDDRSLVAQTAYGADQCVMNLTSMPVDVRQQPRSFVSQNGVRADALHGNQHSSRQGSSLDADGVRSAALAVDRASIGPSSNGIRQRGSLLNPSPATNAFPANVPGDASDVGPQAEAANSSCPEGAEQVGSQMLGGLKQRLLSFIFQGIWDEDGDPVLRAQRLKRFYYHFQQYVDLVMWKVQFLDRYHLLIKFGSAEGVAARNADNSNQTAFFAIYNLETTEMLGFYQNSSEEFFLSYEHFCDHFRVVPSYPRSMSFITSHSNNLHARDLFRKQKLAFINSKSGSVAQAVKRSLATLPFNSQSYSPSPYFDQSLFHFDEQLISASDRRKPCLEHPVKFISRRRPNILKFKVNPGLELGSNDGRVKRVASFVFHPIYPFAISVQQALLHPSIVNFHFRK